MHTLIENLKDLSNRILLAKKQDDYNKSRSDLLKRIKIIEKEDSDLSCLIKKCIHINPKRRPNIYELLDMFKELNEE